MSGYFKIPRIDLETIATSKHFKNYGNELAVYLEIWRRVRFNGNVDSKLQIGQAYIGRNEISERLGMSEQEVRTALRRLKDLTIIQPTPNQQGTIVTICNYSLFDSDQPTPNQKLTNDQPLTNTYNINIKKKKKGQPTTLLKVLEYYKDKYHTAFLTQEFETCREWWYAYQETEPNGLNFSNWLRSKATQARWADQAPKTDALGDFFETELAKARALRGAQ